MENILWFFDQECENTGLAMWSSGRDSCQPDGPSDSELRNVAPAGRPITLIAKESILLVLFALLWLTSAVAQDIAPFSALSGTESLHLDAIEVEGGYMIAVAHQPQPPQLFSTVHKVGYDGAVLASLELPSDSVIYGLTRLVSSAGRHFIFGLSQLRLDSGASLSDVFASTRRFLVEVSNDLTVLSTRHYLTLPPGYLYGNLQTTGTTGLSVYLPGSVRVMDGRLYNIEPMLLFDMSFAPTGWATVFETFEVDGEDAAIAQIDGVGQFMSSAIADDGFYIFGNIGVALPGGGVFGGGPVARYDLAGMAVGAYEYDEFTSGEFGSGSVGQARGGLLYASYYGQFFTAPGCDGAAATIDVRHRDGFAPAHPRFKIPDCGFYTSCREPFLFDDATGAYYFVATNGQGAVALYRYSASHSLLSRRIFQLPGNTPVGIYGTPEGGVLLACTQWAAEGTSIMLYKITPDGVISAATRIGGPLAKLGVYPNPFWGEVRIPGFWPWGSRATVTDMQGHQHGTHAVGQDGLLQLGHLPSGAYVLSVAGADGKFLGSQVVVKAR